MSELPARVVGVPQRVGAGRRDGGRAAEARAGLAHGGRRREPEAPQRPQQLREGAEGRPRERRRLARHAAR